MKTMRYLLLIFFLVVGLHAEAQVNVPDRFKKDMVIPKLSHPKTAPRSPSQKSATHAEFLGIPIEGYTLRFVSKLQNKGFELQERTDGRYVLTGIYEGCKSVIEVISNDNDQVYGVDVFLMSNSMQWVNKEYNILLNKFNNIYSKNYIETERLEQMLASNADDEKIIAQCVFDIRGGTICLIRICYLLEGDASHYVSVIYRDNQNM